MTDWLKGFDAYSRTARLYPCLIAIIPLAGLLFLPASNVIALLIRGGILALSAGAIMYALAGFARFRGKRLEASIVARMGGWPSTTLLRHRDSTIDALTKTRYRTALQKLSGLHLPNEAEEAADPQAADTTYRSATKALMEARRGAEFSMLLGENASYGFWRNLLGVKVIAIAMAAAIMAASVIVLVLGLRYGGGWNAEATQCAYAAAFEVLYIVLLALIASERMVQVAAQSYAEALLRTLDHPST